MAVMFVAAFVAALASVVAFVAAIVAALASVVAAVAAVGFVAVRDGAHVARL